MHLDESKNEWRKNLNKRKPPYVGHRYQKIRLKLMGHLTERRSKTSRTEFRYFIFDKAVYLNEWKYDNSKSVLKIMSKPNCWFDFSNNNY
jgi:hypothetical protein